MNVYQDWGEPHSLKGQMACFMMFEEPLEPEKVKELHKQGESNLISLVQEQESPYQSNQSFSVLSQP